MAYHLTHPDSDQTIEADLDQVPMYLSQGWETKPGANAPTPKDPEAK